MHNQQPSPGMSRTLALLLALGACEGGGDGGADAGDAGTADRPVMDAGSDEVVETDSRPAPGGAPLPAGLAAPRRLLDERATLTGHSTSSCSHDRDQRGARWCAFSQPGTAGQTELWVINVSEALARPAPAAWPVTASSPVCQRLTADLWVGGALNGPLHPYAHRFHGDTLIYYADAVSGPRDVHRGPAFAWRPGLGPAPAHRQRQRHRMLGPSRGRWWRIAWRTWPAIRTIRPAPSCAPGPSPIATASCCHRWAASAPTARTTSPPGRAAFHPRAIASCSPAPTPIPRSRP